MQLFSANTTIFKKKIGHENIEKLTSGHWQFGFFFSLPPKQPRIEYPCYRFLYPMISGTISLSVKSLVERNLGGQNFHCTVLV